MKKIIPFIIGLVLLCSCEEPKEAKERHLRHMTEFVQKNSILVDVSFPDEYGQMKTHQVVFYINEMGDHSTSAMTHWPECKYCKRGQ